jgi:hypothetical protein
MARLHQQAETQADFTAEAVASAARISTVLLYRYVGAEFQALGAQLPGSRRLRDEVVTALRRENVELRLQLQETQKKLRTTALTELDDAIRMIERLEEENLHLRGEVKRLRKQLEDTTRVVVHVPANRSSVSTLTLVSKEEIIGKTENEWRIPAISLLTRVDYSEHRDRLACRRGVRDRRDC